MSDIARRLLSLITVVLLLATQTAHATEPLVIYADGIKPGWFVGGWSKYTMDKAFDDGSKPVTVNMAAWNAITFQTQSPVSVEGYSIFTIVVHGGAKGKQNVQLSFKLGDKEVSKRVDLAPRKGEWLRIDVPVAKLKVVGNKFDTVFINNGSPNSVDEYSINFVLLQ